MDQPLVLESLLVATFSTADIAMPCNNSETINSRLDALYSDFFNQVSVLDACGVGTVNWDDRTLTLSRFTV